MAISADTRAVIVEDAFAQVRSKEGWQDENLVDLSRRVYKVCKDHWPRTDDKKQCLKYICQHLSRYTCEYTSSLRSVRPEDREPFFALVHAFQSSDRGGPFPWREFAKNLQEQGRPEPTKKYDTPVLRSTWYAEQRKRERQDRENVGVVRVQPSRTVAVPVAAAAAFVRVDAAAARVIARADAAAARAARAAARASAAAAAAAAAVVAPAPVAILPVRAAAAVSVDAVAVVAPAAIPPVPAAVAAVLPAAAAPASFVAVHKRRTSSLEEIPFDMPEYVPLPPIPAAPAGASPVVAARVVVEDSEAVSSEEADGFDVGGLGEEVESFHGFHPVTAAVQESSIAAKRRRIAGDINQEACRLFIKFCQRIVVETDPWRIHEHLFCEWDAAGIAADEIDLKMVGVGIELR